MKDINMFFDIYQEEVKKIIENLKMLTKPKIFPGYLQGILGTNFSEAIKNLEKIIVPLSLNTEQLRKIIIAMKIYCEGDRY